MSENNRRKGTRKILIWTLLIFLFCITMPLAINLGLRGIGAILIVADPLKEADAAVALSGDEGDRVSETVRLYKSGYVNALIITFTEEAARDSLVRSAVGEGFPGDGIFITEVAVLSTVDEARAVRDLAANHGLDSLIIITDPFHTLRTRVIFRNELQNTHIDIQVRPVRGHWYRSSTWWQTEEGRRYTYEEYLKVFLYLVGVR